MTQASRNGYSLFGSSARSEAVYLWGAVALRYVVLGLPPSTPPSDAALDRYQVLYASAFSNPRLDGGPGDLHGIFAPNTWRRSSLTITGILVAIVLATEPRCGMTCCRQRRGCFSRTSLASRQ